MESFKFFGIVLFFTNIVTCYGQYGGLGSKEKDKGKGEGIFNKIGITIGIMIAICILCCLIAPIRRRYLISKWESNKSTKDALKTAIDAGDTSKQEEYDKMTTTDTFEEPSNINDFADHMIYYVADPIFNLFYDKWDKYFVYIGWIGDFIDFILTIYIISQFLSPESGFACCANTDAGEGLKCDPYNFMGDYIDTITVNDYGWCVVDSLPCYADQWYDASDPELIYECTSYQQSSTGSGRDRSNGQTNNDEICGENARRKAYNKSGAWLVAMLFIKLFKLCWDYYLTIIQYRERRRVAIENKRIIEEYKQKYPQWTPQNNSEPNGTMTIVHESDLAAGTSDGNKDGADPGSESGPGSTSGAASISGSGPALITADEVKVCGKCDLTEKPKVRYCIICIFLLSSLISFIILYGLEETNGLSFAGCHLPENAAYDEPCAQVQVCAGYRDKTPYVVVRDNLDLDGPAIIAIIASIIGYIAYIPWFRVKVNNYTILKGWRKGQTVGDKLEDAQMWAGLF